MLVDEAWLWDELPERWGPDSGIDQYLLINITPKTKLAMPY